jgi:hypothetical protein
MEENFKAVSDALSAAGLKGSAETKTGKPVDFKITPYSLNTKLSFRFANLSAFSRFLQLTGEEIDEEKLGMIRSALIELGLKTEEFF